MKRILMLIIVLISYSSSYSQLASADKLTMAAESEQKKRSHVYNIADQMPQFGGGELALVRYIKEHLAYPIEAANEGIEGTVVVSFVVNEEGKISDVEAIRKVGHGCTEEAVRLVQTMPSWVPGRLAEQWVKVRVNLPIKFSLNKN